MRNLIGRALLWFIGPALLSQWSREMDEINAMVREVEPISPERISALTAAAVEVRQSLHHSARTRDEREVLLDEIEAYLALMPRPIAETTFGFRAVNDGKFVSRLRKKQNVTLDRIEKCRRFMAENVPVRGRVH